MSRSVTLFTGQWADLPFEELCRKASAWGYDGLEIACWGDHMDVRRAAADPAYVKEKRKILERAAAAVAQCCPNGGITIWPPMLDR